MFEKDSDVPIICDFGIAHFATEDMETLVVTKPTDRLANFQYSAPEQREKGGASVPQTDIFSLGLLLNEMFTGVVPQGLGYKTIREVAPEYDYLDDLFSKMYRQSPNARLYPEQKILTELEALSTKRRTYERIRQLKSAILDTALPEIEHLEVVDKRYQDGLIIFVMNRNIPKEWFTIMQSGSFSHTSVMGYDSSRLFINGRRELAMPMQHEANISVIKDTIKYFNEWVPIVNAMYYDHVKSEIQRKNREAEQRRRNEIETLEKENAIRSMISQL